MVYSIECLFSFYLNKTANKNLGNKLLLFRIWYPQPGLTYDYVINNILARSWQVKERERVAVEVRGRWEEINTAVVFFLERKGRQTGRQTTALTTHTHTNTHLYNHTHAHRRQRDTRYQCELMTIVSTIYLVHSLVQLACLSRDGWWLMASAVSRSTDWVGFRPINNIIH